MDQQRLPQVENHVSEFGLTSGIRIMDEMPPVSVSQINTSSTDGETRLAIRLKKGTFTQNPSNITLGQVY